MGLARPATLALAALISAPALWHAFVVGDLAVSTALVRFLVGVVISAVALHLLRTLTAGYQPPKEPIQAVAERLDTPERPD